MPISHPPLCGEVEERRRGRRVAGTHLTAARTLHEVSSSFSSHAHGVLKCELVLDYMHTASRHVLMFRTKLRLQESSIQTEGSYCGCLYPHTWDNPDQIRTFFINTTYTTCIPNIVGDGKRGGGGGSSQYDLFFHGKHEPKDCGSVSTPMAAVLWLSLHAHGCRPVAQSPCPWLPSCGSVSTPMAAVLWLSLHAHGCRPVAQSPRPWLPSCGSVSTPMAAVLWLSLHAHGCRPVAQPPRPWLPSCGCLHAMAAVLWLSLHTHGCRPVHSLL